MMADRSIESIQPASSNESRCIRLRAVCQIRHLRYTLWVVAKGIPLSINGSKFFLPNEKKN